MITFMMPITEAKADPYWSQGSEPHRLSGALGLKFMTRGNSAAEESYSRLFQSTRLTLTPDPEKSWVIHASGDFYASLNPDTDETEGSIWDTRNKTDAYMYEAYAGVTGQGAPLEIKVGRQYVSHQFSTHLDGAGVDFHFSGRKGLFYSYLGRSVDLFRNETWKNSFQAGLGGAWQFDNAIEAGLEYLYIHETQDSDATPTGTDTDFHQTSLSLKKFWETGNIGGILTTFDEDVESARIMASVAPEMVDNLDIALNYYCQFIDVTQRPSALSPFLSLLGPIKPYHQVSLQIVKGFEEKNLVLSFGGDYRGLIRGATDSQFNHSFFHGCLSAEKQKFIVDDLTLTLHGDVWRNMSDNGSSRNADDSIVTGGGELAYRFLGKTTFALGSYYSLYKYDYYSDLNEKTDVTTVFFSIKTQPTDGIRLNAEFQSDFYTIHENSVIFSAEWRF
jgi:opacity protein-like surface antigen